MNFSVRKVTALPSPLEANTVYYVKGASEAGFQIFVTNSSGTIVATPLGYRASATSDAPTHIPVFTADPSSTTRLMVTRTPAQFRSDINSYLAKGVRSQTSDWSRTLDNTNKYGLWQDNFSWLSSYFSDKTIIKAETTARFESTQSLDKNLTIGWGIASSSGTINYNDVTYCTCVVPLGSGVVDYNIQIVGTITISSTAEIKMCLQVQLMDGSNVIQNIVRFANVTDSNAMLNSDRRIAFTGILDTTGTHTWNQKQTLLTVL